MLNVLQCTGQALQPRNTWADMSVIPRLRDPTLRTPHSSNLRPLLCSFRKPLTPTLQNSLSEFCGPSLLPFIAISILTWLCAQVWELYSMDFLLSPICLCELGSIIWLFWCTFSLSVKQDIVGTIKWVSACNSLTIVPDAGPNFLLSWQPLFNSLNWFAWPLQPVIICYSYIFYTFLYPQGQMN